MNNIKCNSSIAILLGAYNAELYISEQIESIIAQTYKDWTLYIRDDASTDNTLKIIKYYASVCDRICIIEDSNGNLGCNGNYFELLSKVEADYYMFCNADDFWLEDKIEKSYSFIKSIERVHVNNVPIVVHTDLKIGDSNLKITSESYWISYRINPLLSNTKKFIGISNAVAGATMLFNHYVKTVTYPVCGTRPFFDQWIAMKVLQNNGIIKPLFCQTIIYRQIGSNLAAVGSTKETSLLYKVRHLRKVISINYNEAKILKNISWCGYFKYIILKIQFLIKSRCLKIPNEKGFTN